MDLTEAIKEELKNGLEKNYYWERCETEEERDEFLEAEINSMTNVELLNAINRVVDIE